MPRTKVQKVESEQHPLQDNAYVLAVRTTDLEMKDSGGIKQQNNAAYHYNFADANRGQRFTTLGSITSSRGSPVSHSPEHSHYTCDLVKRERRRRHCFDDDFGVGGVHTGRKGEETEEIPTYTDYARLKAFKASYPKLEFSEGGELHSCRREGEIEPTLDMLPENMKASKHWLVGVAIGYGDRTHRTEVPQSPTARSGASPSSSRSQLLSAAKRSARSSRSVAVVDELMLSKAQLERRIAEINTSLSGPVGGV